MRKSDIAYVPNPPVYNPPEKLENMSIEELIKKHIKTCGKADGLVSVCSRCQTPCKYGKRAVQLLANQVYDNPPIPLYAGKTMIEAAREENLRRRNQPEETPELNKKKSGKDGRVYIEDWYSKAMESEDPVKWIMDSFQINQKKAMQKIYGWRSRHPESKQETKEEEKKPVVVSTDNNVLIESPSEKEEVQKPNDSAGERIEAKLELLIRQQEDQKKAMEEYYKLYEQAKAEYEKIKLKIDTLCSAMDIMNEI